MSFSSYYDELRILINRVYVTQDALEYPATQRALTRLTDLEIIYIQTRDQIPEEDCISSTLLITTLRGKSVRRCPGSKGHLCCNYLTLNVYVGCLLGCAYCIMQGYLNFSPLTVHVDTATFAHRLIEIAQRNRMNTVRVGTGEVGDSLHLDPLFELSGEIISKIAPYRNIYLELKSKTATIDHLFDIPDKGNTVIGFSLNPQEMIDRYEGLASSLVERISAAEKAAATGFHLSFHFDPIFYYPMWEEGYRRTIRLLTHLRHASIKWISLGTFRSTQSLKERIRPQDFLLDELIPCQDGKYRYIQKLRSEMYRIIAEDLNRFFPDVPLYLCMESGTVWRNVFDSGPDQIDKLKPIFTPVQF